MGEISAKSITVKPSGAFFMLGEVMVRAWEGTADNGVKIVALISALRSERPLALDGMVSIPPPSRDHSPEMRDAVGRLWNVVGKLLPEEIKALARMGEHMSTPENDPHRRVVALAFIADMDREMAERAEARTAAGESA